jgi:hypothetical protein
MPKRPFNVWVVSICQSLYSPLQRCVDWQSSHSGTHGDLNMDDCSCRILPSLLIIGTSRKQGAGPETAPAPCFRASLKLFGSQFLADKQ